MAAKFIFEFHNSNFWNSTFLFSHWVTIFNKNVLSIHRNTFDDKIFANKFSRVSNIHLKSCFYSKKLIWYWDIFLSEIESAGKIFPDSRSGNYSTIFE